MEESFVRLLLRYLQGKDPKDCRRLWTVVRLVCDDEDSVLCRTVARSIGFPDNDIDDELLDDILRRSTQLEAAKVLATSLARAIPGGTFRRWFDFLSRSDLDDEVLCYLAFGTYRFLEDHPAYFAFPSNLIRRLLSSEDSDANVIALRLLTHSTIEPKEKLDLILAPIERSSGSESGGEDMLALKPLREFICGERLQDYGTDCSARVERALIHLLSQKTAPLDIEQIEYCQSLLRTSLDPRTLPAEKLEGGTGAAKGD